MQQPLPLATLTLIVPHKSKVSKSHQALADTHVHSYSRQYWHTFLEGGSSQIAGGQAPQNAATGTSQSGTEPVSGKLGEGEAGQPYDAGNEEGTCSLPRAWPQELLTCCLKGSVEKTS